MVDLDEQRRVRLTAVRVKRTYFAKQAGRRAGDPADIVAARDTTPHCFHVCARMWRRVHGAERGLEMPRVIVAADDERVRRVDAVHIAVASEKAHTASERRATSTAERRLDGSDVDLLHLQHRVERPLGGSAIGIGDRVDEDD